jgi:hypothetical protein
MYIIDSWGAKSHKCARIDYKDNLVQSLDFVNEEKKLKRSSALRKVIQMAEKRDSRRRHWNLTNMLTVFPPLFSHLPYI